MPQGQPVAVPRDGLTTRARRHAPLLAVHTGAGKGKSTAAFGMALRAWNQGFDIAVFQFVKSAKWKVGEETALTELGRAHEERGVGGPVEWHKMGSGWSWTRTAGTEVDHAAAAADGWAEISRRLAERRRRFGRGHQPQTEGMAAGSPREPRGCSSTQTIRRVMPPTDRQRGSRSLSPALEKGSLPACGVVLISMRWPVPQVAPADVTVEAHLWGEGETQGHVAHACRPRSSIPRQRLIQAAIA